jgi:hypothetical protein
MEFGFGTKLTGKDLEVYVLRFEVNEVSTLPYVVDVSF